MGTFRSIEARGRTDQKHTTVSTGRVCWARRSLLWIGEHGHLLVLHLQVLLFTIHLNNERHHKHKQGGSSDPRRLSSGYEELLGHVGQRHRLSLSSASFLCQHVNVILLLDVGRCLEPVLHAPRVEGARTRNTCVCVIDTRSAMGNW